MKGCGRQRERRKGTDSPITDYGLESKLVPSRSRSETRNPDHGPEIHQGITTTKDFRQWCDRRVERRAVTTKWVPRRPKVSEIHRETPNV